MPTDDEVVQHAARIRAGGAQKYHEKLAAQKKLFVRERLRLLLDDVESFVEDGLFVQVTDASLPADGVVTGVGYIHGRPMAIMANDATVKAGSWGKRTVEKILRIQEVAQRRRLPMLYLVDSAGARITDQLEMFPGRRGAGRIFFNQVQLSGLVPQVCILFGPSAAGGAYIPTFCDIVIMVRGNASMYLGSPRMAEKVIGEHATLDEMGGAEMHCTVSGCGDMLVETEQDAIARLREYLAYFPDRCGEAPPATEAAPPAPTKKSLADIIPTEDRRAYDMHKVIARLVDAESFFEIKELWAREVITGLARLDGRVVGIVANQPKVKGGVLFVDSSDKAARFIWLCDAFNIPLVFLTDVPGFMIGTQVEQAGILRHAAKLIAAVSEKTVSTVCVVVRKAYGAGLYAMSGPGFEPDATLALPTASIAVMGPEPAVNAVYYNTIQELPEGPERDAFVTAMIEEYEADIDIIRIAAENIVDHMVPADELRAELIKRFAAAATKSVARPPKKHGVLPV